MNKAILYTLLGTTGIFLLYKILFKKPVKKMNTKPTEPKKLIIEAIIEGAEKINLSPDVAVNQIKAESNFNPLAKSPAGAMGLAQFMPATWKDYGKGGNPFLAADSLNAYFRFMDDLLEKFNGRLDLVLAAYNWGQNRELLKKALKNKTPFSEYKQNLPTETRNYVTKILNIK